MDDSSHVFTAEESKKITEALCAWIDEEGEDLEDCEDLEAHDETLCEADPEDVEIDYPDPGEILDWWLLRQD